MLFITRHKTQIFGLIFLSAFYFLIRLLPSLNTLPIFTDEAIYTRWAQIALHDPNWRFISLTDGKQPLYIWFSMIFQRFITDPLIAGRLVSVFSGFFTLLGLLLLSRELFKNKIISFITGVLYVVYPFAEVYDRMALMDGMVGTFAVWGLLFGILLVRKVRLDIAYTLGFVLAGAELTKSNGFFSAGLLPLTLILFNFKDKLWKKNLWKWIFLVIFAVGISQIFYSVLRLSPLFYIIAQKNGTFVYTFSEWITHPLEFFIPNLIGITMQWLTYFNVFVILSVAGLLNKKLIRENLLLIGYFAAPFIFFALFAKILYPRYLYPMTLSLIPITALGLYSLSEYLKKIFKFRYLTLLLLIIFSAYPLFVSLSFSFEPVKAPLDQTDIGQYISGWPAGWGVKESVAYFSQQAQSQKIYVGTEGTFGLMPFGLELYLVNNPNITLHGYWPINDNPPADLLAHARTMPTYVLFYQPCPSCSATYSPPQMWNVKKVLQAPRGNLAVYQILP